MSPVTPDDLLAAEHEFQQKYGHTDPGPVRNGLVRPRLPQSLDIDQTHMRRIALPDGRTLWTCSVQSPGALALRLHFIDFDLGPAEMLIYAETPDGPVIRGPYTGLGPNHDGDFWSLSVPGDTARIEILSEPRPSGRDPHGSDPRESEGGQSESEPRPSGRGSKPVDAPVPPGAPTGAQPPPKFRLPQVFHYDIEEFGGQGNCNSGVFGCHLDVNCFPNDADVFVRDATVQITFVSGGVGGNCSATILNDLDGETDMPYLLTAFHCLSLQSEVNTLQTTWFWQTSACNGALPSFGSLPMSLGGTLLETNSTDDGNDMTFIRLPNGSLPNGATLAGWSTAHPDTGLIGVHHPCGSFKRLTFFETVSGCVGCEFCANSGDYDHYDALNGNIQQGSSGSGIFHQGQLVGQLRGICCPATFGCDNLACGTADQYSFFYGEFDESFPFVGRWLQIGGTINVDRDFNGFPQLGTPNNPFTTVDAANQFAWNGARIRIQAGNYNEALTFSKQLTVLAAGGAVRIGE